MTPEERARGIGWCTCPIGTGGDTIGGAHGPRCLVTQIADAIRAAIEAERERAAAIVRRVAFIASTPMIREAIEEAAQEILKVKG